MENNELIFKLRQHNISDELTEESPGSAFVHRDLERGYMICVCPPVSNNLLYFKMYNGNTFWDSTKCARISMTSPNYIRCSDIPEECQWILTQEERDWLISTLQLPLLSFWSDEDKRTLSEDKLKEMELATIWDAIKTTFINNSYYEGLDKFIVENLLQPDYSQLPVITK